MTRILVVEDEAPVRALIAGGLRCDGYEVATVGSGREALARLTQEVFDLLVIDLLMPEMSGYEAIEKIRENPTLRSLPVIMLSNQGDPYNLLREADLGVLDHVQKPFGFREVEDTVRRVVEATPERLQELRVIRDDAAQVYRSTISLIEEVRANT